MKLKALVQKPENIVRFLKHLGGAHPSSELLKKTFQIDTTCPRCKTPLRLIALIKTDDTIKKILPAMGLPTEAPKLSPARSPPTQSAGEGGDWLN